MKEEKKETSVVQLSKRMSEMLAFAAELAKSKIVPVAYAGNPSGIFAAIQYGKELGLGPMVSLQNIAVINGKPSLGSDMMLGLAMKHPEWGGYEILKETSTEASVKVYRVHKKLGDKVIAYTASFSVEDAKRAGLLPAKPESAWSKWLPNMLLHRAVSFVIRKAFPDAFMGLYSVEELDPERGARLEEEEYRAEDSVKVRVLDANGVSDDAKSSDATSESGFENNVVRETTKKTTRKSK